MRRAALGQRRAARARWAPDAEATSPTSPRAAARRYPSVRHWMIWGEPSKASRFQPLVPALRRRFDPAQRRGPRRYARILDAAYAALKRVSRRNLVIGGNTLTTGDVVAAQLHPRPCACRAAAARAWTSTATTRSRSASPRLCRTAARLSATPTSPTSTRSRAGSTAVMGTRPARAPAPALPVRAVDPADRPRQLRVQLLGHAARPRPAGWRAALRITRRWRRIYTLGYLGLYDDPPRPDGREVNRGLITFDGRKKPAFRAFRDG